MKRLLYIWSLIFLPGLAGSALAQYAGATATLEKNTILIGDQVDLELTLTVPAQSKVEWPLLAENLAEKVEIVRKTGIDTVESSNDRYTLRQNVLITSFDSGTYVIPPIQFKYHLKGDTVSYFSETQPLGIDVQNMKVDQKEDIKPIKPPLLAPVSFRELLPWILGGLLLAAAIAFLFYYIRQRKRRQPVFQFRAKPKLPPHEVALDAFERLRNKKLWQAGRIKDYYTELTDIVRIYIEERYLVRALEMTTDEISDGLRKADAPKEAGNKLRQTLVLADLVKFAKEKPFPDENDQSLNHCIDFVRATKPVEILQEPENKQIA